MVENEEGARKGDKKIYMQGEGVKGREACRKPGRQTLRKASSEIKRSDG